MLNKNLAIADRFRFYNYSRSKISFGLVSGLVSPPPRTFNNSFVVKNSKPAKLLLDSLLVKNFFIIKIN